MAMGNLGCCYMQYASLLGYNQEFYRDCLNRHSYLLLNDALESKDSNIYIEGKVYFASQLSNFHVETGTQEYSCVHGRSALKIQLE